jgi:hypothetical protein
MRPLIGLLYKPQMMDDDEFGAIGGKLGTENLPQSRFVYHKSHTN